MLLLNKARRRLVAGAYRLLLLNYRRARRIYWELRAADVYRLYGADTRDFSTVRDILQRYRPESVLDLGCGAGRLFPIYQQEGIIRILGVDISERALALARHAYPNVPTMRVSAEELPLQAQFSLVVVTRVFQHITPDNIDRVIGRVTQIADDLIYLNEITESEGADLTNARYIFMHDYLTLFAAHNWQLLERATIPGTTQTCLLFGPQKDDKEKRP